MFFINSQVKETCLWLNGLIPVICILKSASSFLARVAPWMVCQSVSTPLTDYLNKYWGLPWNLSLTDPRGWIPVTFVISWPFISTSTQWISTNNCADIHGSQTMNPNDFGDPPTFPLPLPQGYHWWFWVKYYSIAQVFNDWLPWNLVEKSMSLFRRNSNNICDSLTFHLGLSGTISFSYTLFLVLISNCCMQTF